MTEKDRTTRNVERIQMHTRARTVAIGPIAFETRGPRYVVFFEGYGREWNKTRQVQVWGDQCLHAGPYCVEADCSFYKLKADSLVHIDRDGLIGCGRAYSLSRPMPSHCLVQQVVHCRDGWLVTNNTDVCHLSRSTGFVTDVAVNVFGNNMTANVIAYVPGALFVGGGHGLVTFTEPLPVRRRMSVFRKAWCSAVVRSALHA